MGPASARSPSFSGVEADGNYNPLVGGSNPPAATIYIKGLRGAARLLRGVRIGRGFTGASPKAGHPGTVRGHSCYVPHRGLVATPETPRHP